MTKQLPLLQNHTGYTSLIEEAFVDSNAVLQESHR